MANLIFPLSMQPPLPKDDGIISASIASGYAASAEASKSQAALEAVQAALEKAAAEQYKNQALAVSQQVTQSKADIDAIRADMLPIHLGRLNGDSAANNLAAANGLGSGNGSVDGVRYYNVTTNKFRVRLGGVWSDEVLPGVSALASAASATSSASNAAQSEASRIAAEAAAASAISTTASTKIASLTVSALRSLAVSVGKSVELLGYYRANDIGAGSFVGQVAAQFNGSIVYAPSSGTNTIRLLTVSGLSAGVIYAGMLLSYGSNITILRQISGDPGGNGTYAVSMTAGQNDTTSIPMTASFVDDGGLYIVESGSNGARAWVRQIDYSAPASAGWWGVKANFTDYDHAPAQKALDAMTALGGHLIFPVGKMRFGAQVAINRYTTYPNPIGYPASNGVQYEFVNSRPLKISGFGCEVHTVGSISALEASPQLSYTQLIIEGFTFHHQNNTQAVAGIRLKGTRNTKILMNTFHLSAKLPSSYASILCEDAVGANTDGATLSDIDGNIFISFGSQDGVAPYCIAMYGGANGVRITRNNFGSGRKMIYISNYPNSTYVANSVYICKNAFEGGLPNTNITGGTISGTTLTVTAADRYVQKDQVLSGTNVIPETTILSQLTSNDAGGALGGAGTYLISKDHTSVGTITASAGSPFVADNFITALTLNYDYNNGATRYMASGIVFEANRLEKLHAMVDITGIANAVQTPLTTRSNLSLSSVLNWVKNPNNLPVNDQDTAQVGAPVGSASMWNNQGFEWAATTPAPVTLTNASITGDILTVGAGANIQPNMVLSGTGVTAETRILWQISGTSNGAGVYKLSVSHTTPVTASAASPITLDHPDPFTYRFTQQNRGIVGRLFSSTASLNNTPLYRHEYVQHKAIGTTASSGDLGTILGSANSTRLMKLRGIAGISAGHEIPYNFAGSVTFGAEKTKLVRFPTAQSANPTRFFGSISGNILTATASNLVATIAVSGDGFTATLASGAGAANGTTPETYNYTLAETFAGSGVYINNITGDNISRPMQEMYYNQLSEINGNYSVFLEYGGTIELSKPLRVTGKSNVGFTIDAGTGQFNYVVIVSTAAVTPVAGAVYRIGGVNYTVVSATSTVLQLAGPSAPPTSGTLTRVTGTGSDTLTVTSALDAFTFTVSGITTAPTVGAVYSDGTNSYTVRATSLTTTPTGYIYGTIHASATLGVVPPASGNLTKSSGTGDTTVAYSAVTQFENRITGPVRWFLVKTPT